MLDEPFWRIFHVCMHVRWILSLSMIFRTIELLENLLWYNSDFAFVFTLSSFEWNFHVDFYKSGWLEKA